MAIDNDILRITDGSVVTNSDNEEVWQGTGVFDALMKAVNANIKIQYDSGRIAGSDYANVYLGALQSVISQAITFELRGEAR